MKLFVGADHNGFALKRDVISFLKKAGYEAIDIGDDHLEPNDDFPEFAARAVTAVKTSDDHDARAILICGSGQGMLMAANRHKGIRAGLGWSVAAAKAVRNDENSNVLALPAELLKDDEDLAQQIVLAWLVTPFAGAARFVRRNKQLDDLA